jgi:hypothetical protein
VLFPCGKCVLKWRLPLSSLVVFEDFESFCKIYLYAHPTCNELVWIDPENPL